METIQYCKTRKVKSPARAHKTDAGIDFYVPEDISLEEMNSINAKVARAGQFLASPEDAATVKKIVLQPGESVLIPSGIKVKVPDGYMLMYDNKSGISTKRGLLIGAKIVDIGYQGECHLNLHNVSKAEQTISAGDKICQGILVKIGFHSPEEVEDEAVLYNGIESDRGDGGFGSSDTEDSAKTERKCCHTAVDTFGKSYNTLNMYARFIEFLTLSGHPCTIKADAIEAIEEAITDSGTKYLRVYTSSTFHEVQGEIGRIRAFAEGWIN